MLAATTKARPGTIASIDIAITSSRLRDRKLQVSDDASFRVTVSARFVCSSLVFRASLNMASTASHSFLLVKCRPFSARLDCFLLQRGRNDTTMSKGHLSAGGIYVLSAGTSS